MFSHLGTTNHMYQSIQQWGRMRVLQLLLLPGGLARQLYNYRLEVGSKESHRKWKQKKYIYLKRYRFSLNPTLHFDDVWFNIMLASPTEISYYWFLSRGAWKTLGARNQMVALGPGFQWWSSPTQDNQWSRPLRLLILTEPVVILDSPRNRRLELGI